jgi:hypothetical protein
VLSCGGRGNRRSGITIHKHRTGPYILLADVAPRERALLLAWLVGLPQPPVAGSVYLAEYLQFLRELKSLRREEEVG